MTNTNALDNNAFENMTLEQIDSLETVAAVEIINQVESNTKWEDTSKHITHNGSGMNCP